MAATATYGSIASGSSLSSLAFTAPSGSNDDLLLIGWAQGINSSEVPGGLTGWTQEINQVIHFGESRLFVYSKVRNGTNDSPTLTWSTDTPDVTGAMVNITGQASSSPIEATATGGDSSAPFNIPDATSSGADRLWLGFGGTWWHATGSTYSLSNSMTVQVEDGNSDTQGFIIGSKDVGSGATSTSEWTSNKTILRCATASLIIAPSAGGGGPTQKVYGVSTYSKANGIATFTKINGVS